jgi:hypothetical protein
MKAPYLKDQSLIKLCVPVLGSSWHQVSVEFTMAKVAKSEVCLHVIPVAGIVECPVIPEAWITGAAMLAMLWLASCALDLPVLAVVSRLNGFSLAPKSLCSSCMTDDERITMITPSLVMSSTHFSCMAGT